MAAIHEFYEVVSGKGGVKLRRKRKACPRCGTGVFLAEHADRYSCGKCGYTECRRYGSVDSSEPPITQLFLPELGITTFPTGISVCMFC